MISNKFHQLLLLLCDFRWERDKMLSENLLDFQINGFPLGQFSRKLYLVR